MSSRPSRSVSKRLLNLRKEVPFSGALDHQPFCLSLRRPSEFSDVHSFGLLKVPHIGVYGDEYSVCSPIILLSMPSSPKCLRTLPPDLISALDLNEVTKAEFSKSHDAIDTYMTPLNFPNRQENDIITIARNIVKEIIDEAVRRVESGKKLGERRESTMDTDISVNAPHVTISSEIWNTPQPTVTVESELNVDSEEDRASISDDDTGSCCLPASTMDSTDYDEELKSVARRLVLKCIQSACNEISARQQLGGSVESLISSTKRMRIDSPPPPQPSPLSFTEGIKNATKSSSAGSVSTPTKSRSPVPERCLTPESLRREKQWKKRGRSESHEVNSLLDYDNERFKFRTTSARDLDRRRGGDAGTITEEYNNDSEDDGDRLNSIMTDLKKMSLNQNSRDGQEEEEIVHDMEKTDTLDMSESMQKHVRFTVFSPMLRNQKSVLKSPPPLKCPPLLPRSSSMDVQTSDIRIALYEDSVPDTDFYIMVHTCPPPGVCQKFMCNNWNEVNLLFHCWLFRDVPCDPSITVSEKVKMGVFQPHNVRPVHLDLLDAGVPFYFMEERSVVIHGCRFSPENAQLQLKVDVSDERRSDSSSPFYSFFSAAQHDDRRVITYHILPSTCNLELALKEIAQNCSTLGQLVSMLAVSFPEVHRAISSFILPL